MMEDFCKIVVKTQQTAILNSGLKLATNYDMEVEYVYANTQPPWRDPIEKCQGLQITCKPKSNQELVQFFANFHKIFDEKSEYEYTFDWFGVPFTAAVHKKITAENYAKYPITSQTLALFCPDLAEMIDKTEQNNE